MLSMLFHFGVINVLQFYILPVESYDGSIDFYVERKLTLLPGHQ